MSHFERAVIYIGIAIAIQPPNSDSPYVVVCVLVMSVIYFAIGAYNGWLHLKSIRKVKA